jgi:hypothetical protein
MVELYQSKQSIGYWGSSNVYNPPNRQWFFDTNLQVYTPPEACPSIAIPKGDGSSPNEWRGHLPAISFARALHFSFRSRRWLSLDLSPRAESMTGGRHHAALSFYTGTNKDATYQPSLE